MKAIGCLLFIFLAGLIALLIPVIKLFSFFTKAPRNYHTKETFHKTSSRGFQHNTSKTNTAKQTKIYGKNDGEYIEFEDIKD